MSFSSFRTTHFPHGLLQRLTGLLPSCCALCGQVDDEVVCADCESDFFAETHHRCIQCALPLTDETASRCGACLDAPPAFDRTIVVTDYAPPVDQLVLSLKFAGQLALAPCFARMLGKRCAAQQTRPDLLMPVPLGPMRLAERGFNQALEIARPLARQSGIEFAPRLLARVRETQPQSLLHNDARQQNMRDAFAVNPRHVDRIAGRHIGIVDDVMTTGETLDVVAALLKRFGAARVTALAFARTPLA